MRVRTLDPYEAVISFLIFCFVARIGALVERKYWSGPNIIAFRGWRMPWILWGYCQRRSAYRAASEGAMAIICRLKRYSVQNSARFFSSGSDINHSIMEGIKRTFAQCKKEKRSALVTYMTAGYPTAEETVNVLLAMEAGGAGRTCQEIYHTSVC